ncbi:MAG: hypothetical protein HYY98_11375 [Burkholderiales bacterium]|nr:hypothetical protein [Burkholderiales bacterium]
MLQEMGVRLWLPGDSTSGNAPSAQPAVRPKTAPQSPAAQEPNRNATPPSPAQPAAAPSPTAPTAAAPAAPTGAAATEHAALQAPRTLYPDANPAQCPPALGKAWLLVAEGVHGSAALAEQAERLLDNMLRALGLHQHPQVYLCTLDLAPSGPAGAGVDEALADAVAQLAPAVVLVMGRAAVRHCLGRSEPLGQLRGLLFTLSGVPAVVTFDAPVLLRSPGLKPAAWEDLCRARALAAAAA